jgi:hypothetical protein
MAYVPGLAHDIFLSYAHGDNEAGWVTYFETRLRQRLREKLGFAPDVWRDERKLGGGDSFPDEIKQALSSTGIVVSVVSPSYLVSEYCRRERIQFSDALKARSEALQVGNRFRLVKAIKTPSPGNSHRQLLPRTLGFDFFTENPAPDACGEFAPGSREFESALERIAAWLAETVSLMRNQKQGIYIAEPPPVEMEADWRKLRGELEAKGYRMLPEVRLDPIGFDEESIRAALEPAALSVHLFGASWDEFAAAQAQAARSLRKPAVIWVSRRGRQELSPEQEAFLAGHAGFGEYKSRFEFIDTPDATLWDVRDVILEQLYPRPKPAPMAAGSTGKAVYLICDRTDPGETERAWHLRSELVEHERLEVILPETGLPDSTALYEEHVRRISSCDAVLLFRAAAPEKWFRLNCEDVEREPGRFRRQPFRSRAIYLANGNTDAGVQEFEAAGGLVIRQRGEFHIESLEPFVAPLRTGSGRAA